MTAGPQYDQPAKSNTNIGYLITYIGELERRTFSRAEAAAFRGPIRDDITLGEAMEAVRTWHGELHDFGQIAPADINATVKKARRERTPDEGTITREAMRLGLNAEQTWMYRRQRLLGKRAQESARIAQSSGNPLFLEPREPKKRVNNRQLARNMQQLGGLNVHNILQKHE